MTLTPLHSAILKVLGEKPLEHTEASYVRARILAKGFGLYDICKAMCSLEEWGQLVMCGLEDSDPEAKMTLLLTPNGRVTATGAALGITSVVLPVAQACHEADGKGSVGHPGVSQSPALDFCSQIDATLAKLDRLPCVQREFAPQMSGNGDGKTEASSQVASWEPSPETLVDRVFTICERAERELVPEEEKWSDFQTSREMYGGIRLVK